MQHKLLNLIKAQVKPETEREHVKIKITFWNKENKLNVWFNPHLSTKWNNEHVKMRKWQIQIHRYLHQEDDYVQMDCSSKNICET